MRALLLLVATTGCLRTTQFKCAQDSDCGAGGTCQPTTKYCSIADPTCGGQRYVDSAGPLANQCVGGGIGDGGIDAPIDGRMIDGGGGGHCPGAYMPITGQTHVYQLVTMAKNWSQQKTFCAATAPNFAYLAIPDDLTELTALDTLAGANPDYWVGISIDPNNNNNWLNVKGVMQMFLPWLNGAPSPGGNRTCVEGITASAKIDNIACNTQLPAICECEP